MGTSEPNKHWVGISSVISEGRLVVNREAGLAVSRLCFPVKTEDCSLIAVRLVVVEVGVVVSGLIVA